MAEGTWSATPHSRLGQWLTRRFPSVSTPGAQPKMFFISEAKPEYRFAVWRESVRTVNTDYIQRMVTTTARELASAHPDKGFDVICTVCDGANEQ